MRGGNGTSWCRLLVVTLLITLPVSAKGTTRESSARGQCGNNLRQIGCALQNYRDMHGTFPDDIRSADGTPLLSWRVRLLPYIEQDNLYKRFHLDEPWDSAHNLQFAAHAPRTYICPSSRMPDGKTCYLLPRVHNLPPDITATRIIVMEVDEEHAVPWTCPADLSFDPAAPLQGLARNHGGDMFHQRGGFILLADNSVHVRLVTERTEPQSLTALVVEGVEGGSLPWYSALRSWPLNLLMGVYALVLSGSVFGSVWLFLGLVRQRPVLPGEWLCLIIAAEQVAHLIAVICWYQYEPISGYSSAFRGDHLRYWFVPSLVAALTSVLALISCGSAPWRLLFGVAFMLFGLVALDAREPHSHRAVEESFVTAMSPVILGVLGIAGFFLTPVRAPTAAHGRRFGHWFGIGLCVLCFAWFVSCVIAGWVPVHEVFVRIRD
jgi:hypothetical protein